MSDKEKRNTLVIELEKLSSHSNSELQQFPTRSHLKSLVGFALISVLLKSKGMRTEKELASMTYGDQRNALVVDVNKLRGYDIPYLSGLGDFDLYYKGSKLHTGSFCSSGLDFIDCKSSYSH